jgi:hypothetical protein
MTKFVITKEELNQIKNDCAYPERFDCEECRYCSTGDLPCTFKGANALMDEVMTRTLEAELKIEKMRVLMKLEVEMRKVQFTSFVSTLNIIDKLRGES